MKREGLPAMHGVTTGLISAICLDPASLEVGDRVFAVPDVARLRSFKVGDHVSVFWGGAEDTLKVLSIRLIRPRS